MNLPGAEYGGAEEILELGSDAVEGLGVHGLGQVGGSGRTVPLLLLGRWREGGGVRGAEGWEEGVEDEGTEGGRGRRDQMTPMGGCERGWEQADEAMEGQCP